MSVFVACLDQVPTGEKKKMCTAIALGYLTAPIKERHIALLFCPTLFCSLDAVIKRYMKEEIVEGHTLVNAVYRVRMFLIHHHNNNNNVHLSYALSTHMMLNLNIFCTCVEHSPTSTIYISVTGGGGGGDAMNSDINFMTGGMQ